MKETMDFIIDENESWKTVFRFYPKTSKAYNDNGTIPATINEAKWFDVSFEIFNDWGEDSEPQMLFKPDLDCRSAIDQAWAAIGLISGGKEVYRYKDKDGKRKSVKLLNRRMDPYETGVSWEISKSKVAEPPRYSIEMWDEWERGCRIHFDHERFSKFADFLEECFKELLG